MNCRSVANILDLYLEKRLSPPRMSRIAAHLKDCSGCRGLLEKLSPIQKKPQMPPADFKDKLKKILADPETPLFPKDRVRLAPSRQAAQALAAAAIYICLVLIFNRLAPGAPSQQNSGHGSVVRSLP